MFNVDPSMLRARSLELKQERLGEWFKIDPSIMLRARSLRLKGEAAGGRNAETRREQRRGERLVKKGDCEDDMGKVSTRLARK